MGYRYIMAYYPKRGGGLVALDNDLVDGMRLLLEDLESDKPEEDDQERINRLKRIIEDLEAEEADEADNTRKIEMELRMEPMPIPGVCDDCGRIHSIPLPAPLRCAASVVSGITPEFASEQNGEPVFDIGIEGLEEEGFDVSVDEEDPAHDEKALHRWIARTEGMSTQARAKELRAAGFRISNVRFRAMRAEL